jgi:glycosyltransferase involved in cell wall biosynthesis
MDRMRRVAILTPRLHGGGAEGAARSLATGLHEAGLHVDVLLPETADVFSPPVPLDIVSFSGQRARSLILPLVGYLRRTRCSALVSFLYHYNIAAALAGRIACTGTRIVLAVQNPLSIIEKHQGMGNKFMPLLVRWIYPMADAVIALSRGVGNELVTLGRLDSNKVKVVYNPVVSREMFKMAKEPVLDNFFVEYTGPIIMGIGSLNRQKNFGVLVEAFARVRRQRPCRLVILGEGGARARLLERVRELGLEGDVWMPGYMHNPFKYLARASVFVLTSRWEGLGNVLIEALALGVPVVAADCPYGPREILENGRWGRLVPVDDVEATADAIIAVLEKPDPPPPESWQRFRMEVVMPQYLEVLGITS